MPIKKLYDNIKLLGGPEMEAEILLIRHGETDFNRLGKIQGQINSELNNKGQQQAKLLGEFLNKILTPSIIVTSDLVRAEATTQALASKLNIDYAIDERLREVSFGSAEGKTWSEISETYGDISSKWRQHEANAVFPGGETREQVLERVNQCIDEYTSKQKSKRIAFITHGAVIAAFTANHLAIPAGNRPNILISNVSISGFIRKESKWILSVWGLTPQKWI